MVDCERRHHAGGRFINPHLPATRRRFWHILLWQMGYYDDAGPVRQIPDEFVYPAPPVTLDPSEPVVTWINHTTFLIQVNGRTILTDPIWSDRCSPFNFLGPKRLVPPPIKMEELPPIDYVLISHDHYDHLDKKSVLHLHQLFPDIRWYVPLGVARWLKKRGMDNVIELDWWESVETEPGMELFSVPAQHYSGRSLFDKDRSLWAGWVIKNPTKRIYFVGDTGYNPYQFKEIGQELGAFDLSIIPIGAYLPTEFMGTVHASPKDAAAIHIDCQSKLSVGSHWGTFPLSSEAYHQPPYDLLLSLQERGVDPHTFQVLTPGQSLNF